MQTWQLQHAKNRFSEVVDKALAQGPQMITRRGAETAVVLSVEEYRKLQRPDSDLVEFFQASPLAASHLGDELDLRRDPDSGRDIEL